jgi:hypothetical protein
VSSNPSRAPASASVAPCGDEDLGVGVVVEAVAELLVLDDRLAQHRQPRPGRVLVEAAVDRVDRRVEHRARAIGVGEPLTEVDAAGARGQRAHLGEDRGAEALQLGGQERDTVAGHGPIVRSGTGVRRR